jgi:hypothetical protein
MPAVRNYIHKGVRIPLAVTDECLSSFVVEYYNVHNEAQLHLDTVSDVSRHNFPAYQLCMYRNQLNGFLL